MASRSLSALARQAEMGFGAEEESQEEKNAAAWGERRNASSTNPTMYGRVMQDRYQRSAGHILPYPGQLEQEDDAIYEKYGDPMKGKSIRVIGPDAPLGNSGTPQPPSEPWSQGGKTDGSAWSQGGGSRSSTKGSPMPVQPRRAPSAVMPRAGSDEIGDAAQTGSGAAVAIARKRQELALAALENANARESIEGQDLDGSQRVMVERGRQQQAEIQDMEVHQPQMQAGRNAMTALEGASKRDEWGKNWDTQAPQRKYEGEQYDRRYVQPAMVRAGASVDTAGITGDSRVDAAEATAGGRVDASRMGALARGAAAFEGQGRDTEARQMMDQVAPMSQIQNTIIELKRQRPNLSPEQYLDLLDFDTPEEQQEAARLLGGQG